METTPRSEHDDREQTPRPFTPVPHGYFEGRCCAACKTPYNCGDSGCHCHDDENRNGIRQRLARTVADLALDPTIPPRRGRIGLTRRY